VDARRATSRGLRPLADALGREERVRAIAAGKAAAGMAHALEEWLGEKLIDGVLTSASAAAGAWQGQWRAFAATHPRPSEASEAAGRAALGLADETKQEGGLLVVCLSGGASAMLAVPAPTLSIADKAATTSALLMSGCDISELNVVRRHLSAIKGGQLAARAGRTITLAISDVCTPVEDDPKVIGSGPTAGDNSTFEDALDIVRRYRVENQLPRAVMAHLRAGVDGRVEGPIPPDDPRLTQSAYWIVASRQDGMRAAADTARALGYHVHLERAPTIGEARHAADRIVAAGTSVERPACVIASGETTVHVVGGGLGGRNQELALAALEPLSRLGTAALASIGTDGRDGPTDAAGAYVDSSTWEGLGPSAPERVRRALDDNNSYPLLSELDALVRTGPTGTNVGDLQVLLIQ